MYTRFYGLREKPFSLTPDPRFLFLSDAHREALAHLLYGIEQGEGFIAVTGEVGTGKTTLCRTLLRRLDPSTEVAFIFHPQLSGLELLQAINSELGLSSGSASRRDLLDELHQFLVAKKHEDRRVLLVVDEAQTLEPDALEQLRLLSNLETETEKLIHIILLGQPELDEVLELPEHRQLRQRITVRWRLGPLTSAETRAYIVHRMRVAAGRRCEIFTPAGLREVHRRSDGVPRLINAICDRSLLAGYSVLAKRIGPEIVQEAEIELRTGTTARPGWRPSGRTLSMAAAALGLVAVTAVTTWALLEWRRAPATLAEVAPTPPTTVAPAAVETHTELAGAIEPPSVDSAPASLAALPLPLEPEAPGFGELLARSSPATAAAGALDALLVAWNAPMAGEALLSIGEVLARLEREGISHLALRSTSLAGLARFDQPALLVVQAMDGAPRAVVLTGIGDDGSVELSGLKGEPVRVAAEELAQYWSGQAYLPWRDFESLPGLLAPGARGASVVRLQQALGGLGLYAGAPTGRYDAPTLAAVRALQQVAELRVDGTVGPVTKIRLYQMAGDYPVPRLRRDLVSASPTRAKRASAVGEAS